MGAFHLERRAGGVGAAARPGPLLVRQLSQGGPELGLRAERPLGGHRHQLPAAGCACLRRRLGRRLRKRRARDQRCHARRRARAARRGGRSRAGRPCLSGGHAGCASPGTLFPGGLAHCLARACQLPTYTVFFHVSGWSRPAARRRPGRRAGGRRTRCGCGHHARTRCGCGHPAVAPASATASSASGSDARAGFASVAARRALPFRNRFQA